LADHSRGVLRIGAREVEIGDLQTEEDDREADRDDQQAAPLQKWIPRELRRDGQVARREVFGHQGLIVSVLSASALSAALVAPLGCVISRSGPSSSSQR